MKLNFTRSQMIRAIVILIAIAFILSTLSMWFRASSNNLPTKTSSNGSSLDNENITTGTGKVALVLDSYSGVLRVSNLSESGRRYVEKLRANNTVLYVDNSNPGYEVIALSRGEDTYEVANTLLKLSPGSGVLLEAYVHGEGEYEFTTYEGKVRATIPRSKINVAWPYQPGETLFFNAFVQLVDGKVVGARLTPLARQENAKIPVLVNSLSNKYYARLYFYWHDRVGVNESLGELNESLVGMGAKGVVMNYIRDDTIYANRTLSAKEVDALKELLPGLKLVQFNKIVVYSNYTYSEDEISTAVSNVTNKSVELSFSPPMLEIAFEYEGNQSLIEDALNLSYKPLSIEVYRNANATTGGVVVNVSGKNYNVDDMELNVWVPISEKLTEPVLLDFEVSILGDRIVSAKQVLPPKF